MVENQGRGEKMSKGYYSQRKQALMVIDDMILNGKTNDEIEYKISLMFGFSNKIIAERRELHDRIKGK